MGMEKKFADFEVVAKAFSSNWVPMQDGTIKCVSGIAQGTGESQRDGRKYQIHSIHIKARVNSVVQESQAAPLSDLVGRFCLVLDTQTNVTEVVATEVMDGGQNNDELSFRNLQHSSRFKVLWDKKFILRRIAQTNEGAINLFASPISTSNIMTFNKYFKTPISVITNGTSNAISDITDNSLCMIGVANNSTCLLDYQVRIRFTG